MVESDQEITQIVSQVGAIGGEESTPHMKLMSGLGCGLLCFQVTRWLDQLVLVFFTVRKVSEPNVTSWVWWRDDWFVVYEQSTDWKELPWLRLERQIWQMLWTCCSISYLEKIGMEYRESHERGDYTSFKLGSEGWATFMVQTGVSLPSIRVTFIPDLATALDYEGVAVRVIHHCALASIWKFSNSSCEVYIQYQGRLWQASRCPP